MKTYEQLIECNCFAVRSSARFITQLYDEILRPTGLKATQFTILSILQISKELTVSQLSKTIGIERTGLTRNLKVVQSNGWVCIREDANDRRIKKIKLTPDGLKILDQAIPLWEKAQSMFNDKMGLTSMKKLRATLKQIRTDVTN